MYCIRERFRLAMINACIGVFVVSIFMIAKVYRIYKRSFYRPFWMYWILFDTSTGAKNIRERFRFVMIMLSWQWVSMNPEGSSIFHSVYWISCGTDFRSFRNGIQILRSSNYISDTPWLPFVESYVPTARGPPVTWLDLFVFRTY